MTLNSIWWWGSSSGDLASVENYSLPLLPGLPLNVILWIVSIWSCVLITPKAILIFPKNFLDFGLNTIKKQDIINLSSYRSKSYTSVVLSAIVLSWKEEVTAFFFSFLDCFVYTQDCIIEEVCRQILLSPIL